MKRIKRVKLIKIFLAAAIGLALLIPQPVNNPRIDMSVPVLALGVDTADNQLSIAAQIILPTEGGGSAAASEVVCGSGKTFAEAFDNLSIALGRKLEFNHCGIIVMGKECAESGINSQLEYLLTAGMLSPNTNLAISANKDAKEFIDSLNEYGQKLTLTNLLRYTASGSQNFSCTLIEYLRQSNSPSKSTAMPCIKMGFTAQNSDPKPNEVGNKEGGAKDNSQNKKDSKDNDNPSNGQENESKESESKDQQTMVESALMTAIFKDGKLINILGAEETKGLSLLDPRTRQGKFFIKTNKKGELYEKNKKNESAEKNESSVAINLIKKKIRTKTQIKDNTAIFNVCLDMDFVADNPNQVEKFYDNLNNDTIDYIKECVYTAYNSLIKNDCDAINIQDSFYRNHHKDYLKLKKQGYNFLIDSNFLVEVKIKIK